MHGILSNLGVHLTENQEKQVGSTSNYIETTRKSKCLSIWTYDGNTVYIGFYDQPPSQGSRSLNPIVVAKLNEFSLGLTTRWSLKPMQTILRWV